MRSALRTADLLIYTCVKQIELRDAYAYDSPHN